MAWRWYTVNEYKVSLGGERYYAGIQLFGDSSFYASLRFERNDTALGGSAPSGHGARFWGNLDYRQMQPMLDLLRNESPVRFGWNDANPDQFHLMTGQEPVGEGDGVLAEPS